MTLKKDKLNNGVFPKWGKTFTEFSEFKETDSHWSMYWAWFKDPVSHMCLAGAAVSYTKSGWVPCLSPFTGMTIFCHWIQQIQWKHLGKTPTTRGQSSSQEMSSSNKTPSHISSDSSNATFFSLTLFFNTDALLNIVEGCLPSIKYHVGIKTNPRTQLIERL